MATKECPACGNIVGEQHLFCPACGTKLIAKTETKKTVNKQLESDLFKVESVAEVNLASQYIQKLYNTLTQNELQYLNIIEKYGKQVCNQVRYNFRHSRFGGRTRQHLAFSI